MEHCALDGTGAFTPGQPRKGAAVPWDNESRRLCGKPDERLRTTADEEREIVGPMLPAQGRMGRPLSADPPEAVDAVRHVLATGRR